MYLASEAEVRWSTSQEATSSRREGFTAAFGTAASNTGNSFGLCRRKMRRCLAGATLCMCTVQGCAPAPRCRAPRAVSCAAPYRPPGACPHLATLLCSIVGLSLAVRRCSFRPSSHRAARVKSQKCEKAELAHVVSGRGQPSALRGVLRGFSKQRRNLASLAPAEDRSIYLFIYLPINKLADEIS